MNVLIVFLVSILLLISCKDNQVKFLENCADEKFVQYDWKPYSFNEHQELLLPVEFKIAQLKTESKKLLKAGFTEKEITDHIRKELKLLRKDLDNLLIKKTFLQNDYQASRKKLLSFLKKSPSYKMNNDRDYYDYFNSCEYNSIFSKHSLSQKFQKETYTEVVERTNYEVSKLLKRYQLLNFDIDKIDFKNFTL